MSRYPTSLDLTRKIGTITVTDELDLSMLARSLSHLWSSEGKSLKILCDVREGDLSKFDGASIKRSAEGFELIRPDTTRTRCAYLVSRDVDFGIAKMIENLTDRIPVDFGTFRDYDEAWAWLSEELAD